MEKLKGCPMCGNVPFIFGREVKEYADGKWAKGTKKEFWIRPRCEIGCLIGSAWSSAFGSFGGVEFISEEAAIAAWNIRFESTCKMEPSFGKPTMLDFIQEYLCSECGEYSYVQVEDNDDRLLYCSHCGARVEED